MKTLSIQVSDRDYSFLEKIANADNRRLSDLLHLIFAEGLEYMYLEQSLSIERSDDEITDPDELKKIKHNEALIKQPDFHQISQDERIKRGFDVSYQRSINNCNYDNDRLIAPIARRIREVALEPHNNQSLTNLN